MFDDRTNNYRTSYDTSTAVGYLNDAHSIFSYCQAPTQTLTRDRQPSSSHHRQNRVSVRSIIAIRYTAFLEPSSLIELLVDRMQNLYYIIR